jgi:transcriptional regulator with XRE-family HTH domain
VTEARATAKRSSSRRGGPAAAIEPASDVAVAAPASGLAFGTRLRHQRMVLGRTLKAVAAAAGCSESLLSKLENGRANPSVRMLHRIAAALDVNVGSLFAEDDSAAQGFAMRADQRPLIDTDPLRGGSGIRMQRLVPYAGGHLLQGNIHVVEPGGESAGYLEHAGEEVGYVIEGEIDLTVGDETATLRAGDSFNFRSDRPHRYRNNGTSVARIVWINTPPTF